MSQEEKKSLDEEKKILEEKEKQAKTQSLIDEISNILDKIGVKDQLEYQHRKATARKEKIEGPELIRPTFEICLQRLCRDMHKCYNLTTHQPFNQDKKCDKVFAASFRKARDGKDDISGWLSRREIAVILTRYRLVPISNDQRDLQLEEKLREMAKSPSVRYESVI